MGNKMRKRKRKAENEYYTYCNSHEAMVRKLARIEGENVVIIALVAVIISLLIEKMI